MSGRSAVTSSSAGIGDRSAGDRDEAPVVTAGAERELENAVSRVVAYFEIRHRGTEVVQRFTASCPHGDFTDAERRVQSPVRLLRGKALIGVIVTIQDQIGAVLVERVPQRTYLRPYRRATGDGAEARMMPHGHYALL